MEEKIIPVLMYHSIQNIPENEIMRSLHVKPRAFAIQMWLLKALGYRGCSVSEVLAAFNNNSSEKLVGLTFDDGYENFYYNALPVLRRFKFSATVYCVSNLIGKDNQWDRNTGISYNPLMTEEQIRNCLNNGIEIGCHSATHQSLIEDNCDLPKEIKTAKTTLENRFGVSVSSFCYPYGHFNDKVVSAVNEAGFTSATTMMRSRAKPTDQNRILPRIPVNWHTLPFLFLLKILSGYEDRRRYA
jgi:peptidoglycan/xylan/chitin deacetylase (PgdA/CDA1 family)